MEGTKNSKVIFQMVDRTNQQSQISEKKKKNICNLLVKEKKWNRKPKREKK